MSRLTDSQKQMLIQREPSKSAEYIAGCILKFENLDLEDFKYMIPAKKYRVKILLDFRPDPAEQAEWSKIKEMMSHGPSLHLIDALKTYIKNWESLCLDENHVDEAFQMMKYYGQMLIDMVIHNARYHDSIINQELFYDILVEERGDSLIRYIEDVFSDDKFNLFTIACNLYAYAIRTKNDSLLRESESLLSSIDSWGLFGRYAYGLAKIAPYLLPYTVLYIPELEEWIRLLEYAHDRYPCMPDMEWWRREGQLSVSKSIYSLMQGFIMDYPDSVFRWNAERICAKELPVLYRWLYTDIRNNPERYPASALISLIRTRSEDIKKNGRYDESNALDFFLYFHIPVTLHDLVEEGALTDEIVRDLMNL